VWRETTAHLTQDLLEKVGTNTFAGTKYVCRDYSRFTVINNGLEVADITELPASLAISALG
jgi:hypothetical protein